MRIAIEAHSLTRRGSGVTTYVRELLPALREARPTHDYKILNHGPTHEALAPLWLNTTVPKWLKGARPDVVHFTKAALPHHKRYPTVVTIHDVIPLLFPRSQKLLPRLLWPATLRHAANSADHILTISERSKQDIIEHLQVSPEKVTAAPLAVSYGVKNLESSHFATLRPQAQGRGEASWGEGIKNTDDTTPYILFLGTIEPRKNVPALIRAFARIAASIPHKLIIAGRPYRGINDVRQAVRLAHMEDRVELRDFVPKEQLPSLYAGADLFVWPSIYEGWGFPPQEAMAMGTPVIVSNGGSLPEVVGDAGETVHFTVDTIAARTHDEAFEAALAERMQAVLTDPAKQAQMSEAGLRQAHKNSWADVARVTLDVYRKVVES